VDDIDLYGNEGFGHVNNTAKPSQAKVLTGGGDLREAQVDVPGLLAISAFDRKARINDRQLNSKGEYVYANDFEGRLGALADLDRI